VPQNLSLFTQIQFETIQISATQQQELTISSNYLEPEYTYKFLVTFVNILGTHG
jgi:hypothetical protein